METHRLPRVRRLYARLTLLVVLCGALAAGLSAIGAAPASAAAAPCFAQIPPFKGNPQWGFHTGSPIAAGKSGSYSRAIGDVNLSSGAISGTVCQVNVAGGVQRLIVLKPRHVLSHTHYGKPFGHLGNLMSVQVKVTSSTDKNCKVGTTGTMTVNATYNGVKSASVQFVFPASCKGHDHTYHSPQVDALVPES
jgi:hypothetical protein